MRPHDLSSNIMEYIMILKLGRVGALRRRERILIKVYYVAVLCLA